MSRPLPIPSLASQPSSPKRPEAAILPLKACFSCNTAFSELWAENEQLRKERDTCVRVEKRDDPETRLLVFPDGRKEVVRRVEEEGNGGRIHGFWKGNERAGIEEGGDLDQLESSRKGVEGPVDKCYGGEVVI